MQSSVCTHLMATSVISHHTAHLMLIPQGKEDSPEHFPKEKQIKCYVNSDVRTTEYLEAEYNSAACDLNADKQNLEIQRQEDISPFQMGAGQKQKKGSNHRKTEIICSVHLDQPKHTLRRKVENETTTSGIRTFPREETDLHFSLCHREPLRTCQQHVQSQQWDLWRIQEADGGARRADGVGARFLRAEASGSQPHRSRTSVESMGGENIRRRKTRGSNS